MYVFGTFTAVSAFLSAIFLFLGFPRLSILLGSLRGWGEVKVWGTAAQMLIFILFVHSSEPHLPEVSQDRQAFYSWHFSLTSLASGWLPDAVLRVQFPWHRRPLRPPLDPWNICTSLSCKTLMEQAALLLPSLLAIVDSWSISWSDSALA